MGAGVLKRKLSMSETSTNRIDLELFEKVLKIANLSADTALKDTQRHFIPWQFFLGALTLAFAAGGGLVAGIFSLIKWHYGT